MQDEKRFGDVLRRKRAEAKKLKQEAEREWEAAKAQFETELLGEP